MSLLKFIKRPAIRDAFKTLAIPARTPSWCRGRKPDVASVDTPPGMIGTAFDYLARFHLSRQLQDTQVTLLEGEWIAEKAQPRLDAICGSKDRRRWRTIVRQARKAAKEYAQGADNLRELADLSQQLASLDVLYRSGRFDPAFKPSANATNELMKLIGHLDPLARFSPQNRCILNPSFDAGQKVGGADADLVIDDRLIDLKTSGKLSVRLDDLLQIVGYAALQRLDGLECGGAKFDQPFQSVELYFARFGELLKWRLEDLFPDKGFDRFCAVFEKEMNIFEEENDMAYPDFEPEWEELGFTIAELVEGKF